MKNHFTTKSLADMRLPGYPTTDRGWDKLVKTQGWEVEEFHGARGRGGVRREYLPPPEVMILIAARQRGELPPAERPRLAKPVEQQANTHTFAQLFKENSAWMALTVRLILIVQNELKFHNIADEMLLRVTMEALRIIFSVANGDVQRCNQLLDNRNFGDPLVSLAYQAITQEEDARAGNVDR